MQELNANSKKRKITNLISEKSLNFRISKIIILLRVIGIVSSQRGLLTFETQIFSFPLYANNEKYEESCF